MASTRKRASCLVSLTPPRVTRSATLAQEHVSPAKQIKFPRRSIHIKQAIPCILHLENRTLLKLLFLMLREGLANAQGKLLEQTRGITSMSEREAKFIEAISTVMNEEILGSLENKAQWKLPTESNKGENLMIGTINIENYRGRKIMENFDKIIEQ